MDVNQSKPKMILIAALMLIGLFLLSIPSNAQTLRTLEEKTFQVSPGQDLNVEADLGDVKINTWDRNEVFVKILGNKKAADKMEFSFDQDDQGVKIKAEKEGSSFFNWFGNNYSLKIDIKVPVNFNAKVYTAGGDVILTDLKGNSELKTSGGDISVASCQGKYLMKTSGGDVHAESISGKIEMSTSGGDVIARQLSGDTDARTSGGDVKIDVADGQVYGSTSGGDVTLYYKGQNKGITLKTSGGDIDVTVGDEIAADLDLKTSGGDIKVDVTTTRTNKVSSSRFEGNMNGGGPKLECRTSGGDITLKSN